MPTFYFKAWIAHASLAGKKEEKLNFWLEKSFLPLKHNREQKNS